MSCFRRPCGNQRVNGFQTLLNSARHHYYPFFPCIWDILSWKKSALVWSEMTTLFVNTLTAHNKYSPLQCAQFWATSSNAIISKIKDLLSIFYCISEMCMQFRTFWKKRWVSQPNYFRNYGLREGWLLKRLKGRASEDHAVINVLTFSKHCWNQKRTTIILFFHAFGIYWVGKSLH